LVFKFIENIFIHVVVTGSSSESETKSQILSSELWTTIFRGGYATERLQRSISGKLVSLFSILDVASCIYMYHFIHAGQVQQQAMKHVYIQN